MVVSGISRIKSNYFKKLLTRRIWLVVSLSLVLLLSACPTYAQQTLADADWFVRPLGDGVVWKHYLFDNLFGGKQSVSYLEIDLDNPNVTVDIPYENTLLRRISTMVPDQFPNASGGINGTYFNTTSGGHRTYLRVDNVIIPPGGTWSPWGYEAQWG